VRDALLADPELTERQKQMLIEVYESFRRETAAAIRERTALLGEVGPGVGAPQGGGPETDIPGDSEPARAGAGDAELAEDPSGWFAPDEAPQEPDSAPGMGRNRVA
jgi:hypothetical protein